MKILDLTVSSEQKQWSGRIRECDWGAAKFLADLLEQDRFHEMTGDGSLIIMTDEGIRPPLNSIPGLGTVAAESIDEAKKEGKFMCIDDLQLKAKIGKSVIELLKKFGCLDGMSQSNQMSLFG